VKLSQDSDKLCSFTALQNQ